MRHYLLFLLYLVNINRNVILQSLILFISLTLTFDFAMFENLLGVIRALGLDLAINEKIRN